MVDFLCESVYHKEKEFSNEKSTGEKGGKTVAFFFTSEINRRSSNEDSYCQMEIRMNDEAAVRAMVVADGMGGLSGGKYYSDSAVKLWYQELLTLLMSDKFRANSLDRQIETLIEFSEEIYGTLNQRLYKKGLDAGIKGGTTLSTVIHFWDTIIVSNCGDSPIYQLQNGTLKLVSEIQNVAEKMVKEGKTAAGSIVYYQNKNRLLDYLGKRKECRPYCTTLEAEKTDGILLGSDGAFGDLSTEEIASVFHENVRPQKVIGQIFEKAREAGEEDNQTAIFYLKKENMEKKKEKEFCFPKTEKKKEEQEENICCYTKVLESKRTMSLKEKILKNRFIGGR